MTRVSKQIENFKNKIHHHCNCEQEIHKQQVLPLTAEKFRSVLYNSDSLTQQVCFLSFACLQICELIWAYLLISCAQHQHPACLFCFVFNQVFQ